MELRSRFTGLILAALLSSLAGAAVCHADQLEELEGTGLEIRSDPNGASVYIDGIHRGRTPLVLEALAPGSYSIRLTKDGYGDRNFKVTIPEDRRVRVFIEMDPLTGRIVVNVVRAEGAPPESLLPLEPELHVGDVSVAGLGPVTVPVGFHTVRLRAFGWRDAWETVYVFKNSLVRVTLDMEAAEFSLDSLRSERARFNPNNPGFLGATDLSFEVTAPGRGGISVSDSEGRIVFSRKFPEFETWLQSFRWDGRDRNGSILPDGVYTVAAEGESIPWDGSAPVREVRRMEVEIDSSLRIRPQSLGLGSAGLLLSPGAETLPAQSFQMDASVLFGRPYGEASYFDAPPFILGLRFSPADLWDIGASAAIVTSKENPPAYLSVSALRAFGGSGPFGVSAGVKYSWSEDSGLSPLGLRPGLEFYLPLRYAPTSFLSFTFAPAVLWTGPDGYPSEALPRAVLAGGAALSFRTAEAGVSLREEFRLGGEAGAGAGPLFLGAELRLFPPPSVFVLSLMGGAWFENSEIGYFGGLGLGIIH